MDNLNVNISTANRNLNTSPNYAGNSIANSVQPDCPKDSVEISSKKEVNKNTASAPPALTKIGSVIPKSDKQMLANTVLTCLAGLAVFGLAYKMLHHGGSASKSGISDTVKNVTTKFSDVAGIDEVKNELMEVVDFLKNPEKYTKLGGKIPKGVLLSGPPGTGKTLLAKAVAGEAGVPFISVKGSEFEEMFVGVGASRVRKLFANAREHKKCIIFIDELDCIGKKRTPMNDNKHEQSLLELLAQMDGFKENNNENEIIIMGATNRPEVLDPALLRPGRLDRQITVNLPDVTGREAILKVHAKGKKFAKDVSLENIAKGTSSFSGAELANLLNESAILAVRNGREEIAETDINEAIRKILCGPARKGVVMSAKEKMNTSFHEIGHALISEILEGCDPLHEVSIIPRGSSLGQTINLPEKDKFSQTKNDMLARITMLLGGRAAEELGCGVSKITTGASNDIERATNLARQIVIGGLGKHGPMDLTQSNSEITKAAIDKEVEEILANQYKKALELLTQHKSLFENLSNILCARETLTRRDFIAVTGKLTKQQV